MIGNGKLTIGNLTVSNSGGGSNEGSAIFPVGTYQLVLKPAPGTISTQFLYGVSVVISNYALRSHVTLQNGTALMEVIFTASADVSFGVTPRLAPAGSSSREWPERLPAVMRNGGATMVIPVGALHRGGAVRRVRSSSAGPRRARLRSLSHRPAPSSRACCWGAYRHRALYGHVEPRE